MHDLDSSYESLLSYVAAEMFQKVAWYRADMKYLL